MSELRVAPPPPRADLLRSLRAALGRRGRPLRVLAEDLLGLDRRIDLLACEPDGRPVLVLLGEEGEDLELVADGLAQRAWLAPRLADHAKLAPDLGLATDVVPALLLVAPAFGPRARAAAESADPITLVRCRFVSAEGNGPAGILLETERPAGPDAAGPGRRVRSRFRTGLRDADLAPIPAEVAAKVRRSDGSDPFRRS